MNVSELSDVELNRAMIWLYPPEHRHYDPIEDDGEFCWSGSYEDAIYYEYLTDYNLTMPLAVENGVSLINDRGTAWAGTDICAGDGPAIYMENASLNKKPLRAICEVLIMIAMEKKG